MQSSGTDAIIVSEGVADDNIPASEPVFTSEPIAGSASHCPGGAGQRAELPGTAFKCALIGSGPVASSHKIVACNSKYQQSPVIDFMWADLLCVVGFMPTFHLGIKLGVSNLDIS